MENLWSMVLFIIFIKKYASFHGKYYLSFTQCTDGYEYDRVREQCRGEKLKIALNVEHAK